MSAVQPPATPRVAVIGAGFSGLCLGIQLKKAGIHSFTIFEKASRLGGTWRDNTYPGACCDVPAMSYCFSFEQKTDWTRKWVAHDEILAYMDHCAAKYGLLPHCRFQTEIAGARFDEHEQVWHLRTAGGETVVADILACGTGQLNRPHIPDIPGLQSFRGMSFHSARWNHAYDLQGKRIAVIGNAASAIQFIPQIAPQAAELYIFQRTPNWMVPRGDRAFTDFERKLFARAPWIARLLRWWTWLRLELAFYPVIRQSRFLSRRVRQFALEHMRAQVADPRLHPLLTPSYPPGAKRILISDDYYPTLNRKNVHLVTAGIDRVTPSGLVTRDGAAYDVDAIILATGFQSTAFLAPMRIEGRQGRVLEEVWRDGAEAYLGMTVAGFPNLFMMYGPNTNLGHNSIIFMIECQANYIVDCLRKMMEQGVQSIDVRPEVMAAYNGAIQEALARTVWGKVDRSWYKTAAGKITNNWSGSTLEYWWKTRRADLSVYLQEAARQRAENQIAAAA